MPAIDIVSPLFETADSFLSGSSTMSPQFIDTGINTDEIDSSRTIAIWGKRIGPFGSLEGVIFRVAKGIILTFAVDFW